MAVAQPRVLTMLDPLPPARLDGGQDGLGVVGAPHDRARIIQDQSNRGLQAFSAGEWPMLHGPPKYHLEPHTEVELLLWLVKENLL